jgi:hypothetical protein
MTQVFSTLRLCALFMAMLGTAAYATPGTITPEQDDYQQEDQIDNGDDFFEEDDGYGNEDEDQDDNWGDDDGYDGDDRGQNDGRDDRGQNDGRDNGKGQNGRDQDDGYDRPGKPGYGKPNKPNKPRYDRRPRRLVETVPVRQQFFGGARFPLYMMVNNLQRFQGYRLVGIVINGSSDAGMGMAVFCGSQCGPMQNVGYYINSYPIRTTGERVNQYSAQWFLELRGNFWVDSIQLQFAR